MELRLALAGLVVAAALAAPFDAGAQPPPDAKPTTEPEPRARPAPELAPYVTLSTGFGGGARSDERVGVLGGELLLGAGILVGHHEMFVAVPSFGWAGARTFDAPNHLLANTFTARLDLGWFNLDDHYQGLTLSCAGKVGTGREAGSTGGQRRLAGAQLGLMWWPYRGVVGLEFQAHLTHYRGVWREDLRVALNLNLIWAYTAIFEAAMARGI